MARAIVTLTKSASYTTRGYHFKRNKPETVTKADDIEFFKNHKSFSVKHVKSTPPKKKAARTEVEPPSETTDETTTTAGEKPKTTKKSSKKKSRKSRSG